MSILDKMTILEAAELIRVLAIDVANEKDITYHEAWNLILKDIKEAL